jgi:hypothetical protein
LKNSPSCADAYGGQASAQNLVNKTQIIEVPGPFVTSNPGELAAYNLVNANNKGTSESYWSASAVTAVPASFRNGPWTGAPYHTFVGNHFANATPGGQETILLHEMAHPLWQPNAPLVDDINGMYSPYGGVMFGIPGVCGTEPLQDSPAKP